MGVRLCPPYLAPSLRRLRRPLQQLVDVAGQDRLAVLSECAQLPDEVAHRGALADFLRIVGKDGEAILSGNVDKLLKQPAKAA